MDLRWTSKSINAYVLTKYILRSDGLIESKNMIGIAELFDLSN